MALAQASSTTPSSRKFVLASRASQLAQIQTNSVADALKELDHKGPTFSTAFMSTAGDKNQSQALYLLGGKALWTKELEVALKEREVDMVVHSLKDMPTTLPEGCLIGGVLKREDPVDSLIVKSGKPWKSLEDLPEGSVIGTSSVRRVAQLKRNYPKLTFLDVRLDRNTRFAKLDASDGPYAALILAKAGIVRLGMGDRITADLPPPTLYHAVSQGALAVEIRNDDAEALALCRQITHWETEWTCMAERACLRTLEGGCSVPIGVSTNLDVDAGDKKAGTLTITGCVTSLTGDSHIEHTIESKVSSVEEAEALGTNLARTLSEMGAKKILDDINVDRARRVAEAEKVDKTSS
ncbi:hypothetical protein H0H93_013085 [Arthromyces matolae]|nr:hypothetical protein H0H93_013085 [Arthromyces matolae]